MKKLSSSICCIFFFCCNCFAQYVITQDSSINKKNNIQHNLFLEFWGSSSGTYNITYDCSFPIVQNHKIAIASGFEYIPSAHFFFKYGGKEWIRVGVSLQANYLYGKKHNHLEIGSGIIFPELFRPRYYLDGQNIINTDKWEFRPFHYAIPLRIGYRHQKSSGGFFWKIGLVYFFSKEIQYVASDCWVSVAFGYTLKSKKHKLTMTCN